MKSHTGKEQLPMSIEGRIRSFAQLGHLFRLFGSTSPYPGLSCGLTEVEYMRFDELLRSAVFRNAWFTEDQVRHMLGSLAGMLSEASLRTWIAAYPHLDGLDPKPRTVGTIMAGNIPLVGFHDLLCVLLAGHLARVKASSDDAGLTPAVVELLRLIAPDLGERIVLVDGKLGAVDAVIATGSNNTARYFDHYFGHLPRIVRRNRSSVALLDGTETDMELEALGEDLFRYFGLGCRNVSKILIPEAFDLDRIFKAIFPWNHLTQHNKWLNNYEYHKAIWLLDQVPLIENGFVLFKEDRALHSPLGSIYFERYSDRTAALADLEEQAERIQCVVGHGFVPFGQSQHPGPGDYADGVDTLRFLTELT